MTMKFSSSQSPDSFRPRPARGAEVASGFHDEKDDGIEFDPRRDIFNNDIEEMKREIGKKNYLGNWWNFSRIASNFSLLFPDRKCELNLNDEAFDGILRRLKEFRHKKDWWNFVSTAVNLCTLFPERKKELKLNGTIFEAIMEKLEEYRSYDFRLFGVVGVSLVGLFPDRKRDLNLND